MQTAQIADGDRWSRTSRWARGKAGELFGADLRSLAALRIALAVIVLADLAGRARHLTVHYTDDGVLPRSAALRELSEWQISLHLMNGTTYVQAMLLGATALAALALLVGYRTRPMSVIVWAMMLSLQWRNPAVLSDADTLLRLLLFWAMFLPLGARWSVDRARAGAPALVSTRFLSLGTFALFMQIAFVYWFTVLLKTSDKWREDGSALYYAMMNDQFTTSLGASLRPHDTLLQILTFATLGIEAIGPFLLFCPVFTWRIRTATVAAFMGLHLGILLTMDIGLFPWLSALCMVGFLPSRFWEAAIPRVQAVVPRLPSVVRQPRAAWDRLSPVNWQPFRTRLAALGGAWRPAGAPLAASAGAGALGDFPLRSSPPPPSAAPPGAGAEPTRARSSPLINLLAAACLLYVFGWNLMTVSDFQVPDSLRPVGNVLGLKQSWDMFSPQPNTTPGWFVVPGVLADGEQVDLVLVAVHDDPARVRPVSWERPDDFSDIFSDKYWRKYLMAMRDDSNLRTSFARYVCREWNATHDGSFRLVGLEIVYVRQQTLPDQQWGEPRRDELSEHTC